MYIDIVPNRNSPPAILLREAYREDGKVKKRTKANLSFLPLEVARGLQILLKGGKAFPQDSSAIVIHRTLPHGHVAAVLGMLRAEELDKIIGPAGDRCRDLVVAMIVARLIDPGSKLNTVRGLQDETATSSLALELGLGPVDEDDLYNAMDWLFERQSKIENALAKKHLNEGTLVLYDVSSSYLEGNKCPLGQFGYSRDGKKHNLQIIYGLLCSPDGCPVAVEVFEGNVGDPTTITEQVKKLKERFGLNDVVLVGDRGMITEARIREDLRPANLDWITALRAPKVQELVEESGIQLSLFDDRELAAVTSPSFPGERLIVCRNPLLADERARKREELLQRTERHLENLKKAVERKRNPLKGEAKIGAKFGEIRNKYKVAKHFDVEISEGKFSYRRNTDRIAQEANLDGIYVIRTSVSEERLDDNQTVRAYKGLARVERAFRTLKGVDLQIRPVYHHLAERVRAHVFLCMLAYYVEWHMRKKLGPMLYDDCDKEAAEAERENAVRSAKPSPSAQRKVNTGTTETEFPVQSFHGLLKNLATIARNTCAPANAPGHTFTITTTPTPIQKEALELLGVPL